MKKKILYISTIILPILSFAQKPPPFSNSVFKDWVGYVVDIVNLLIPILWGGAFIVFFWGLSKFVIGANNEAEVKKGKEYMMWGILALFVMVTMRSILNLASTDLGLGGIKDTGGVPLLPTGQSQ